MKEAKESEEIRFLKRYLAKHGRLRTLKALNKDLERKKKKDERKPTALSFTILKAPKRKIEELAPVKPKKIAKDGEGEKTVTIPKEFKKLAKNFGLPEEHLEFFYENRSSFNWEYKDKTKIYCAEQNCKFKIKHSKRCLIDHVVTEHNYEDIPCDHVDCSFVAHSRTNLLRHKQRFHGHGKKIAKNNNFNCPYESCKNSFSTAIALRRHLCVHENKFFFCQYCPFKVATKYNFFAHMSVHFNIKNFSCEICSKTFYLRDTMETHIRDVHSNDDYVCEDCGFVAQKRNQYRKHRETCAKRLEYSRIL